MIFKISRHGCMGWFDADHASITKLLSYISKRHCIFDSVWLLQNEFYLFVRSIGVSILPYRIQTLFSNKINLHQGGTLSSYYVYCSYEEKLIWLELDFRPAIACWRRYICHNVVVLHMRRSTWPRSTLCGTTDNMFIICWQGEIIELLCISWKIKRVSKSDTYWIFLNRRDVDWSLPLRWCDH